MLNQRTNGKTTFLAGAVMLLSLTLYGPPEVRAQWTTTGCGTNNVCNTNTGNVGVGTSTSAPTGKLEVKGDTSDSTASAISIRNSSNTSLLLVRNDGNIGIGTNSPGFRLSVEGPAYVVAQASSPFYAGLQLRANDYGTNGGYLLFGRQTGNNTYSLMQSGDSTSYRTLAINPFGGNVGVGTTSPVFKLDVVGQVRSSSGGFVFPDGTTQATAASGTVTGITAGNGLTGGGSTGSLSLNVGAGTGLTVGTDSISVNYGSAAGTAVQGNTSVTLTAGSGLSGGGPLTLGAGGSVTLTNSDKGSAQNIFKNVANAAGAAQFSAESNNDDQVRGHRRDDHLIRLGRQEGDDQRSSACQLRIHRRDSSAGQHPAHGLCRGRTFRRRHVHAWRRRHTYAD